jgi:PAS domain-containing protein
MDENELFDDLKLVDASFIHIFPSQPSPANLGSTIGELIRQGIFSDSPLAAKLRKMLKYPMAPGDSELMEHWIVASDGACIMHLEGGLHRGSVLRLPNRYVLLRVYRIWHDQDVSPLTPPHSDVVGCALWDIGVHDDGLSDLKGIDPTLIYANEYGKQWMGDPDCIGKSLNQLAPELIESGALAELQEALTEGRRETTRQTFIFHQSRKHRGWIYDTHVKRVSKSCILASFVDISQKTMHHAIRSHLYSVLNAVPALCLLATSSMEIAWLNSAGRQLAEIPAIEDNFKLNIKDLMPEMARVMESQQFTGEGKLEQIELISRTGRKIPVSAHFVTFSSGDGPQGIEIGPGGEGREEARLAAVFAQDLTSELEHRNVLMAEKNRAEEATTAKSDFLATMSHEMRTPLHGIVGTAELLEDASPDDVWQQQQVRNIRDCSSALLTIINDLLDFAKIEVRISSSQVLKSVDGLLTLQFTRQTRSTCNKAISD